MEKIRQFLYGRYGNDALNTALIILGCAVTFLMSVFRVPDGSLIGLIPYAFALGRGLSRNTVKRRRENEKFVAFIGPWRKYIVNKINQIRDKEHKYYHCPRCHHVLRVPKGMGKIKISCPHCSKEFVKKT